MIELRDVCYSYGNGKGVEALSCAFAPGTLCGIVGPNGSGKSTSIRLLGGLLRAERGDVFLDGRSIRSLSRRECAKLVSLFPQGALRIFTDQPAFIDQGVQYLQIMRFSYLFFSRYLFFRLRNHGLLILA